MTTSGLYKAMLTMHKSIFAEMVVSFSFAKCSFSEMPTVDFRFQGLTFFNGLISFLQNGGVRNNRYVF